jgi:hypothetical protein
MKNIHKQIDLIVSARKIRIKDDKKTESSRHRDYIFAFINRNKIIFYSVLILLLTQGIIEALLVFISKNKLSFNNNLSSDYFWKTFILLIVAFALNSFFAIKQEKTLIIRFINDLRRRIFKNYLGNSVEKIDFSGQADLIAKISYHLPLISSGVSNSIVGIFRWLIYFLSALLVVIFSGLNVVVIIPFFLLSSLIITVTAYFIVKQYISQEVTFYSQIIRHSNLSLSEKQFVKNFNLENDVLNKFDDLVRFDSVFRVRRDLWIKMVFRSVFILLILVSVLTNLFYSEVASWINLISPDKKFLYFFLLIYVSRLFMESARIGLYFFPAQLGISLSNIKTNKSKQRQDLIRINQSLSFNSRKTKIYKEGKYIKKLAYNFTKGARYLFYSHNYLLKKYLAFLLAGRSAYKNKAVFVKVDGKRLSFLDFQKSFSSVFAIDPDFYSEKSLLEIIVGRDREFTDFSETTKAISLLENNRKITSFFSSDNNLSLSSKNIWLNHLSSFALHYMHCVFSRPDLVIIDSRYLDENDENINLMIKKLSEELPQSIIIVFASDKNDFLNYDKIIYLD